MKQDRRAHKFIEGLHLFVTATLLAGVAVTGISASTRKKKEVS